MKKIYSPFSLLGKAKNIFSAKNNTEYKIFLREYGTMYGLGTDIRGPVCNDYEQSDKVKYIIIMSFFSV